MNVKKLFGAFVVLLCTTAFLQAQEKTVTGNVVDQTGFPLPGVNIIVEGTTIGTQTDFDGNYVINAAEGRVLLFTYLGQKNVRRNVGSGNVINVQMEEDAQALEEVVVTALGLQAKPRELVFGVQEVDAKEIANTNEVNIATALAAKAAGVQVVGSSGSVGASTNIRIRGSSSINRNNSPLYVIDGVPIDDSSSLNDVGGVDNSNRAIDINQNDIESISILKGIAAQTLYGLRASNGVILITTKSGQEGKPKVTITSNLAFSQANQFPDLQQEYAQGRPVGGVLTWRGPDTSEGFSWGPAIADLEFDGSDYPYDRGGRLVPTGTGNGVPARAYDHLDFFQTGILSDLNVSVSGGTEKINYFLSGGLLNQTGITPLEEFDRKSFRANINAQLTDKLSILVSGTYINSGGRRNQRGSNISGIMLGLLRTTPTFDNSNANGNNAVSQESTYQLPDGTQRSYRAGIYDNPYWTVVKNPSFDDVNRFIGNFQFNYELTDWLTVKGTYGYDHFTDSRKLGIDINSAVDANGQVIDRDENNEDITTQLLFIFNKDLGLKWNLGATLGYDGYRNRRLIRRTDGFGLTIPGFFHVSNTASQTNQEINDRRELRGALSNVTLGYDNMVFLNGSFRNDWSSTLPADNNSFQSYSIGASFVFSELFNTDGNGFFNFGKLRASWGATGNDAPTFSTETYYNPGSVGGDGFITNNVFPVFSTVAFERSALLGNDQIVPESTTEFEIGAEFRFFDSRLGLDIAYYNRETTDQIIQVSQPATTGFTNRTINAGVITNDGWEITANIIPIRTENFQWDINVNFTAFDNVVEELVEGIEPILLNGFVSTSSRAVPGESYGSIFGTRWLRDENGNQLVDASNGLAIADPENGVVGDPIPDYTLGMRNTFTYKSLSLTALFDYRKGGDVWCGTCGILDYFGTTQTTADLREGSYVVDGITANFVDGAWVPTGQQNTTSVPYADPAGGLGANRWVRYGFGGISEDYVFDGSFFKLREIALTYALPNKFIKRAGLSNASITLAGRNLVLITDFPGIDPETNLTGDSNGIGLDYFNQPFTESYSLAVRLTF